MIEHYVLPLQEVDELQVAVVGGKGAHLRSLSRIEGVHVPVGFYVTTDAFRRITAEAPSLDDRLDQLSLLNTDDGEAIGARSAEIRRTIEAIAIPDDLTAAITGMALAATPKLPSGAPRVRQAACSGGRW